MPRAVRDPKSPPDGRGGGPGKEVDAPEVDLPEVQAPVVNVPELDAEVGPRWVPELDAEVEVPEIDTEVDPDDEPQRYPEIEAEIDVTPRDVTPHDVTPPEADAPPPCTPIPRDAAVIDLRQKIADERQKSLRDRTDHDADQSFPASDPPGGY